MERLPPIRIVNIFAKIDFGAPIDLRKLSLSIPSSAYDPESVSGLVIRTSNPRSCVTIFRSGSARCTGCKSLQDVNTAVQGVVSLLRDAGEAIGEPRSEIRNVVGVIDFKCDIDLTRLALAEEGIVEYEPEQFPGAIVRPSEGGSVLVFKSGRAVITGVKSVEQAEGLERYIHRLIQQG